MSVKSPAALVTAVRLVQALLGTGAVALVFVAADAWFGRRAAWVAAAMAALTGLFTFYESLLLTYQGGGTGPVSNVQLRRSTDGTNWTVVRQDALVYYDGTTNGGNSGDLKTETLEDASGNAIDTNLYTYFKTGSNFVGGYAQCPTDNVAVGGSASFLNNAGQMLEETPNIDPFHDPFGLLPINPAAAI